MRKKAWRHVVLNTRCSWLHGDERGFRTRDHRIHSSGDYKNPPPKSEHEGLRDFHKNRSGAVVEFEFQVQVEIIRAFVSKARALGHEIISVACGARHLHAEMELPLEQTAMIREIGKCKQRASHAVRALLPGSIWSEGGTYKQFKDRSHFHFTYDYIRTKQEEGSVVWSHRDDENWIDHPEVGVIVMGPNKTRIRVFGVPHTPASECTREDPDSSST